MKFGVGIIVASLLLLGGAVFFLSRNQVTTPKENTSEILVRPDSYKASTPSATLTLVEFADYQCPTCGAYYLIVKQLQSEFSQNLNFVFRNFPLTNIHKNAYLAAQAAAAAGLQNKYWLMHDKLFETQKDWSEVDNARDIFVEYAKVLGLNIDQFKKDLDSTVVQDHINQDLRDGNSLGVNATPTFYLNGEKIPNLLSLDDFRTLIKAALLKNPIAYHIHFDIKVYRDNRVLDLSLPQYQSTEGKELDPDIHLHDGNGQIVHIHKKGATLSQLFKSLNLSFDNSYKLYVNGKLNSQFLNYEPQDLDKILVTNSSAPEISSVSDQACVYSEKCPERGKPPTENCVGGLGTGCSE